MISVCQLERSADLPIRSDALFIAVYAELKRLALQRLRRLPAGQTWHATMLVHEAYLKIAKRGIESSEISWSNPDHFMAAASEAMRCILIDHYRRRHSQKRGGQFTQLFQDMTNHAAPEPEIDLLALDEVVGHFELHYPEKSQIVKLRFYVGMTMPEIAQALDMSLSTVERHWRFSRAWLAEKLEHFHE